MSKFSTKSLVRVGDGKKYPCLYIHPNGTYYFKKTIYRMPFQRSLFTDDFIMALEFYRDYSREIIKFKATGQSKLIENIRNKQRRVRLDSALTEWIKLAGDRKESAGGIRGKRYIRNRLMESGIRYIDQFDKSTIQTLENNFKDMADNSQLYIWKVIKSFLNFCISKKYYSDDSYNALVFPVIHYKKRTAGAIIPEADYHKILEHPEIKKNTTRAMYVMALWECGVRPKSEGRKIKYEDIDWINRSLRVEQSKIEKSSADCVKNIPLSKEFTDRLKRYCELKHITAGLLFHLKTDNPAYWLSKHWTRLIKELKLNPDYTPYSFRHTFATRMYRLTKDVEFVRAVMGHTSLEHTLKYLHTYAPDLTEKLDKALKK